MGEQQPSLCDTVRDVYEQLNGVVDRGPLKYLEEGDVWHEFRLKGGSDVTLQLEEDGWHVLLGAWPSMPEEADESPYGIEASPELLAEAIKKGSAAWRQAWQKWRNER